MGILSFDKLPANTHVGADWRTFKETVRDREIDPGYRTKYHVTKAVCRLLSAAAPIQEKRYEKMLADKSLENPPVFILGHWRSGTTFTHNVLSCDRHFGYVTTYQTVFPHLMLWGQPFFKTVMNWLIPSKRPTDNVVLGPDLPQEEDFAMTKLLPYSYYDFWFFPRHQREYAEKYLLFRGMTREQMEEFRRKYVQLVKIALWNTGGTQFLSKNPPHTAHVRELLEIFPDAKFIYLIRNPYTVFESTRKFYDKTIRSLMLQNFSEEEMESAILDIYTWMYDKYEADKKLVPQGNLFEMKFEDFEADPVGMAGKIYSSLGLQGFEEARPAMEKYTGQSYNKNKYRYQDRTVRLVEEHWGYALKQWDYGLAR